MTNQTNLVIPQDQQSSSAKPELQQHELVDKLAPEPSQLQPLTILSGFLGQSPRPGYWRLYLTPALGEYVEIPEGDIVHNESTTGRTTVWVRSGTPLQYTHTTSRQVQADFLRGSLTTGFRARATGFLARSPQAGFLKANTGIPCSADICSIPCGSDVCGTAVGCTVNCLPTGLDCLTDSCRTAGAGCETGSDCMCY